MLRLDEKKILIKDFCDTFADISRFTGQINPGTRIKGSYFGCLPKKAVRLMHTTLVKDLIKGLRQINRKFPVYIELPNLKKEGNGMYSENYDISSQKGKEAEDKEIIVCDCSVSTTTKNL